ncbi:MAG: glycoside hydrolase family 57 protein [Candidatus Omnitrophota bacterium]
MSKSPTKVIFIWHMHQPSYMHPEKNYYILPWVRFHGIKDYYGMAKTLDKFDRAKAVFNFSGILVKQLLDYTQNNAQDYYGMLTLKKPSDLSKQERDFIINRFFSINFERFIKPNPRYLQLYNKKISPKAQFCEKDIGDLQALFNLCWFHPYSIKDDKKLKSVITKGKDYDQSDRQYIIKKQYDILSQIIPLYKRLVSERKIELSLTPYHHPIMPLIYDTDILKDFSYSKRPLGRFNLPSDCIWHLRRAKEVFKEAFGRSPCGSWPSEGSVSESVVSQYRDEGFKWIGTDEAILFKSLTTEYVSYDMIKNQRHIIYRPHNFKGVEIFFRDRNLSDAISFIYQGWEDSVFAANDLLEHFKRTHYHIKDMLKERAIVIIMDGENAWEYYKNNGVDFLETVYSALEKTNILSSSTASEFLRLKPSRNLERLSPGSWINGDFGVWIGSKENNLYWQILRKVKDIIDNTKIDERSLSKALDYFHLIEGSDWYWWNTFEDINGEFSNLFYSYVKEIFRLLGRKVPSYITSKHA